MLINFLFFQIWTYFNFLPLIFHCTDMIIQYRGRQRIQLHKIHVFWSVQTQWVNGRCKRDESLPFPKCTMIATFKTLLRPKTQQNWSGIHGFFWKIMIYFLCSVLILLQITRFKSCDWLHWGLRPLQIYVLGCSKFKSGIQVW